MLQAILFNFVIIMQITQHLMSRKFQIKRENKQQHHLFHKNGYTFIKKIGNGGYSIVWLAIQDLTQRQVTIKCYKRSSLTGQSRLNLDREIKIQKSLDHPRILKIFEFFQDQYYAYLVLEYCRKGDLLTKISQNGRLSESVYQRYFSQLVLTINYLHDKQIYHRDIKPENILIDDDQNIKLCDFGLSCECQFDKKMDEQCGSPSYISPQIAANKPYYPWATDIWSLGVTYYAMMTGQMLFDQVDSQNNILQLKFRLSKNIPQKCRKILQMILVGEEKRIKMKKLIQTLHNYYGHLSIIDEYYQVDKDQIQQKVAKLLQKKGLQCDQSISKAKLDKFYAIYMILKEIEVKELKLKKNMSTKKITRNIRTSKSKRSRTQETQTTSSFKQKQIYQRTQRQFRLTSKSVRLQSERNQYNFQNFPKPKKQSVGRILNWVKQPISEKTKTPPQSQQKKVNGRKFFKIKKLQLLTQF